MAVARTRRPCCVNASWGYLLPRLRCTHTHFKQPSPPLTPTILCNCAVCSYILHAFWILIPFRPLGLCCGAIFDSRICSPRIQLSLSPFGVVSTEHEKFGTLYALQTVHSIMQAVQSCRLASCVVDLRVLLFSDHVWLASTTRVHTT